MLLEKLPRSADCIAEPRRVRVGHPELHELKSSTAHLGPVPLQARWRDLPGTARRLPRMLHGQGRIMKRVGWKDTRSGRGGAPALTSRSSRPHRDRGVRPAQPLLSRLADSPSRRSVQSQPSVRASGHVPRDPSTAPPPASRKVTEAPGFIAGAEVRRRQNEHWSEVVASRPPPRAREGARRH